MTPLHFSAGEGHLEICHFLVKVTAADPAAKDIEYSPPTIRFKVYFLLGYRAPKLNGNAIQWKSVVFFFC